MPSWGSPESAAGDDLWRISDVTDNRVNQGMLETKRRTRGRMSLPGTRWRRRDGRGKTEADGDDEFAAGDGDETVTMMKR
jgi:hypothetical protein